MKTFKALIYVTAFGLSLWLLAACTPAATPTPAPPTATATPVPPTVTPTPSLPGAAGAPLVFINTPTAGVKIKDAFITAEDIMKYRSSGQKPASTKFPSGTSELSLVIIFCPMPADGTEIGVTVHGVDGEIELDSIVSFIQMMGTPEDCLTFWRDLTPKSGTFVDGGYQAILNINSFPVAEINWSVGTD